MAALGHVGTGRCSRLGEDVLQRVVQDCNTIRPLCSLYVGSVDFRHWDSRRGRPGTDSTINDSQRNGTDMNTRVLPLGSSYTGSNGSPHAPVAAHSPAAGRIPVAAHAPFALHSSAPVRTPAPIQAPVTYGNRAPVVIYQQVAPTNTSAIVALVLTLISFVTSVFFLGFIGIIFGHAARSQIKARWERGNGMAVAALWLGYLSVIFWVVFWLIYFGVIALVIGTAIAVGGGTVS